MKYKILSNCIKCYNPIYYVEEFNIDEVEISYSPIMYTCECRYNKYKNQNVIVDNFVETFKKTNKSEETSSNETVENLKESIKNLEIKIENITKSLEKLNTKILLKD